MIKLSVNETKWSSLLARTRALILYISILIFDFGPEKLPGLSKDLCARTARGLNPGTIKRRRGEGWVGWLFANNSIWAPAKIKIQKPETGYCSKIKGSTTEMDSLDHFQNPGLLYFGAFG